MGRSGSQRRYSQEFKRDAVALLRSSGRPVAEVARELGVTDTSLGAWARELKKGSRSTEMTEEEKAEAAQLRKRIRELEQEIDILKRFTSYWVSEGR